MSALGIAAAISTEVLNYGLQRALSDEVFIRAEMAGLGLTEADIRSGCWQLVVQAPEMTPLRLEYVKELDPCLQLMDC